MKIKTVHLVYFSATYTTRTIVRGMAQAMGCETVEHDVTCSVPQEETALAGDGELLIASAPVYAGRIPGRMAEALRMFSGSGTPAIVVCVYGNRDYDDALVELQDCVEAQGFRAVAAAAFIGRHCIFPAVAAGRPDDADMQKAADFASRCASLLAGTGDIAMLPALKVKGNRPYKQGGHRRSVLRAAPRYAQSASRASVSALRALYRRPTPALPTAPGAWPADAALWCVRTARACSAATLTPPSGQSSRRRSRQGKSLKCFSRKCKRSARRHALSPPRRNFAAKATLTIYYHGSKQT